MWKYRIYILMFNFLYRWRFLLNKFLILNTSKLIQLKTLETYFCDWHIKNKWYWSKPIGNMKNTQVTNLPNNSGNHWPTLCSKLDVCNWKFMLKLDVWQLLVMSIQNQYYIGFSFSSWWKGRTSLSNSHTNLLPHSFYHQKYVPWFV